MYNNTFINYMLNILENHLNGLLNNGELNETAKIFREWSNCDLIFLGSPDANLGSAIVMDYIFKTFGEKRTVIKERTDADINQFPFALRKYFNNDTTKIHDACKFNNFC